MRGVFVLLPCFNIRYAWCLFFCFRASTPLHLSCPPLSLPLLSWRPCFLSFLSFFPSPFFFFAFVMFFCLCLISVFRTFLRPPKTMMWLSHTVVKPYPERLPEGERGERGERFLIPFFFLIFPTYPFSLEHIHPLFFFFFSNWKPFTPFTLFTLFTIYNI